LCGEAPDGEIALSQIEASEPDVLITDIKMPFMDGLQLCKIIREHMPWMKIIIISGYNDFQYAQNAIRLGVTEYLVKPVSVKDLETVLARVAVTLNQERVERAYLKQLRSQAEDNLGQLREKFLLRLVTGGESSVSAIEQSQQLGLNILSPYYQVVLLELKPVEPQKILDYPVCQMVESLITELVSANNNMLITHKGMEEHVLIIKGESLEQLEQETPFLVEWLIEEVGAKSACKLVAGIGQPQQRLGDLNRSFAEALMKVKGLREDTQSQEIRRVDRTSLRRFLEHGKREDLDTFVNHTITPFIQAALSSRLLVHYALIDMALTATQFVSDIGGNPDQVIPTDYEADAAFDRLSSLDQIKDEIQRLLTSAMTFRDRLAESGRSAIIQQAKSYIADHFSEADLSLNQVAEQVSFSPNHFSAIFRSETGLTFRDYLANTRIEQAKKLLVNSSMKCSEIAYHCGYNDPHYFSLLFRRSCGQTPQQFRNTNRKSIGKTR
jgi:two-component system response regulator YesN